MRKSRGYIAALKHLFLPVLLVLSLSAYTQDLAKITDKSSYDVSGGLSVSSVFYDVDGIPARRDPFYWQLNANLTFKVAGIVIPFSASFSQQERDFAQPFNQFGLSPEYKSVKVHLGYRSMNFSSFTLGGKTFLGAGVEYDPENLPIKVGVLYGRFARAIQFGGNDGTVVGIPTYERWGYGTKFTYGNDKNNVSFMFFRGRDDENSLDRDSLPDDLFPEENLVWGISTKNKLGKRVSFDMEYAFSGFTRNTLNNEVILQNFSYYNNLGDLFTPNATTQYNKALLTNINYNHEKYNLKLSYRRIDPDFQSMGTPFLNNDLEDITGAVSWKMLKNKLNITTTGGFQRNNLDQTQVARVVRVVAGLNTSYNLNEKTTLTFNYSNFNTSTNQEQFIQVDSVEYFQVTHSVSMGANYRFTKGKINHMIMANTSIQRAFDSDDNNTLVNNTNVGHQMMVTPIDLSFVTSLNHNRSSFQGLQTIGMGPSFVVSKQLLKRKVQTSFTYSLMSTSVSGTPQFILSNYQLSARYTLKKKHSFTLSGIMLNRSSKLDNQPSFLEKRVTIQYGYRF